MAQKWRVALGCDEAAYEMKQAMIEHVRSLGHEVKDFGTHDAQPVLYPDIAFEVAQAIADFNGDGFPDLVVVNNFNGVKTNLNSYIYWGDVNGIDLEKPTELPTKGASGAIAADLNDDGRKDVVFFNKITES